MSWAARRRAAYIIGILLFFGVVIGVPLAFSLYRSPSCTDGKQNQNETDIDKGGSCPLLDERYLSPESVLWSRSFLVRGGNYSAVAYVENPNKEAGVRSVSYRFGLYDSNNILVAERRGTTFIMPDGITPVFEGAIDTGNRAVARTYFEFTGPLVRERMMNAAGVLSINNKAVSSADSAPRLSATVTNTSVAAVVNPSFVAVISDAAGNAFAASATTLARLSPGARGQLIFTWPDRFTSAVGRVDIIALMPPLPVAVENQ